MGLLEPAPTTKKARSISFSRHGLSGRGIVLLALAAIVVGTLMRTKTTPACVALPSALTLFGSS